MWYNNWPRYMSLCTRIYIPEYPIIFGNFRGGRTSGTPFLESAPDWFNILQIWTNCSLRHIFKILVILIWNFDFKNILNLWLQIFFKGHPHNEQQTIIATWMMVYCNTESNRQITNLTEEQNTSTIFLYMSCLSSLIRRK